MMSLPLYIVDTFTDQPFRGNPAAVCLLDAPRTDRWLQDVAREMNLSETAFLLTDGNELRLRWFTPTTEVPLCGHATLAAAHILWETGLLSTTAQAHFSTLSGTLTVQQDAGWIVLDFPAAGHTAMEIPPEAAAALGSMPVRAARITGALPMILIEYRTAAEIHALRPDFSRLCHLPTGIVLATAPGDEAGVDFVSRFFAPAVGVNEDPVTGVAHCALGPYWHKRLNKCTLIGYQASARGGTVRVTVESNRVLLSGQAITIISGKFQL